MSHGINQFISGAIMMGFLVAAQVKAGSKTERETLLAEEKELVTGELARALLAKETRALLPIWSMSVLAATLGPLLHHGLHDVGVIAFAIAFASLGAYSIGHEYTHRTVGLMLTLPIDRRLLSLIKLGVLVAMAVPLAAYASVLRLFPDTPELPWVIAAGTIGMVPGVTILCRSPLGGVMFSAWGSAMLLIAAIVVL